MRTETRVLTGIVIAVMGLLLATHVSAQFGSEPAELELIAIRDDLYVISNPFVPGLTTALVTDEGVLLVDDKFEIDHDDIMALLRTVTEGPVKHVINTHYHSDHSGGNAMENAIAIASDQARARMVAGNQPGARAARAEIESVVRAQFDREDFHVQSGLGGLINEFR